VLEPGRRVGGAGGGAEALGLGRPGDLRVEVGLGHGLLLAGERLLHQRPRDQDLQHLDAVPVEAGGPDLLQRDGLAVDEGGNAGAGRCPGRIIHHVLHPGRVLEGAEIRGGGLAAAGLAEFLDEPRPHVGLFHVGRRQVSLALDDDELVRDLHHRRDFPDREPEGRLVELRLAGVELDRLHPAVHAGAAHVHGVPAGEDGELIRLGYGLGAEFLRLAPRPRHDDPRLDGRAELLLERGVDLLRRRLGRAVRQPSQGEHRPDDVVGILPGGHAALALDQFQILFARNVEPAGQGLDLGLHVFAGHDHVGPAAGLLDDPPVHERFQDRGPMPGEALRRESVGGDLDAVDERHRLCHAGSRLPRPGGRRRHGIGLAAPRQEPPGDAAPHHDDGEDHLARMPTARPRLGHRPALLGSPAAVPSNPCPTAGDGRK